MSERAAERLRRRSLLGPASWSSRRCARRSGRSTRTCAPRSSTTSAGSSRTARRSTVVSRHRARPFDRRSRSSAPKPSGGEAEAAVPGAVALELVHNFSLIHDDIMDGDRSRRHRRTVWDVYGVGDAIIVGDALHTLAFRVLLDEGTPAAAAAMPKLTEATAAMIAGQAQDLALERRSDGTVAECVLMEHDKTAALLGGSVAVGALLAGAPPGTAATLERFGVELGLAFQAIDDVLGIWGDPQVTGKPVGSDLRERKKSLPVMLAIAAGGEPRAAARRVAARRDERRHRRTVGTARRRWHEGPGRGGAPMPMSRPHWSRSTPIRSTPPPPPSCASSPDSSSPGGTECRSMTWRPATWRWT